MRKLSPYSMKPKEVRRTSPARFEIKPNAVRRADMIAKNFAVNEKEVEFIEKEV